VGSCFVRSRVSAGEGGAGARTGGRASSMGWEGVQRAAITPSSIEGAWAATRTERGEEAT